jgi:hypothetical protein
MCDPADQQAAWVILAVVLVAYFGVLYISVRHTTGGAWLRIAATWLFSAAAVTIFVLWGEEAGVSDPVIVLVCAGLVAVAALGGIGVRGAEPAWRYVTAGVLGGVTPIALVIAGLATLYATGGCLS